MHAEDNLSGAAGDSILQKAKERENENAETRDRTGDLQIFSLTLSQLSYRGSCFCESALLPVVSQIESTNVDDGYACCRGGRE